MDRVFQLREDWFDVGIVPAIRRRTIISALLIALCSVAWLYWKSWVPLSMAAMIVTERIIEFAHIPKTKEIIGSLSIRATENGLSIRTPGTSGSVVYPWTSLTWSVLNNRSGEPESILINDRIRKNSKMKLIGYEGMSELIALIEDNAQKP